MGSNFLVVVPCYVLQISWKFGSVRSFWGIRFSYPTSIFLFFSFQLRDKEVAGCVNLIPFYWTNLFYLDNTETVGYSSLDNLCYYSPYWRARVVVMVCQAATQTRFRTLKHENGIAGSATIIVRVIACFQPLQDCQVRNQYLNWCRLYDW